MNHWLELILENILQENNNEEGCKWAELLVVLSASRCSASEWQITLQPNPTGPGLISLHTSGAVGVPALGSLPEAPQGPGCLKLSALP